ncbi:MAG: acyltransferase [Planctomycetaceae bacterium]
MTNSSVRESETEGHIPSLDGVRGLAIIMVIGFHLIQGVPCIRQEVPGVIRKLSSLGQTGVDLFFVLSGFLITGILLKHRSRDRALVNFWGRRFLRIFPLYYVVLAVVLFFPALRTLPLSSAAPDWWMWTYLANMPPTLWEQDVSLPHFWSLAVEEQFYLFWPLLILSLRPRNVGWVCITLFILAPLARGGCLSQGWSSFYALPCRMDTLAAGGWLATQVHLKNFTESRLSRFRVAIPIVVMVSGVWFLLMAGKGSNVVQIAKHSICSVIFLWLIAECAVGTPSNYLNKAMCWSWLRGLGKYSYGLYVIHPLVMALANLIGTKTQGGIVIATGTAIGVAGVSLALSMLSWSLLESPCLKLKRYFRYDVAPQASIAVAEVAE